MWTLLIERPLLALIPAAIFLILAVLSRRRIALAAAAMWALYAMWELGMKARILCSGECNIRVDLLLIYPILGVVSVVAFVWAARYLIQRP